MPDPQLHVKFNPSYILATNPSVLEHYGTKETKIKNLVPGNDKGSNYKGRSFSEHSRRKMKKRLQWFEYLTDYQTLRSNKTKRKYKYKLAFVTLTLPATQAHTNNKIKSTLLNNFLTTLRKYHNLTSYIWKAELQKNGNIHFHIITDLQLHYSIYQKIWNTTVENLNYITRFESKHNKRTPPSTKIQIIYNNKSLNHYVQKYMSKLSESDIIEGRHWSNSQNISKLDNRDMYLTMDDFIILEALISSNDIQYHDNEGFSIWLGDSQVLSDNMTINVTNQIEKFTNEGKHLLN